MPANEHLEVYKFCRQHDITFAQVQGLRSGGGIRKQSQKISLLVQTQLLRELADGRANGELSAIKGSAASVAPADDSTPVPGLPERPRLSHVNGTHVEGSLAVGAASQSSEGGTEAFGTGLVEVWELARELQRPAAAVTEMLRAETATKYGWTPNDKVPAELAERVRRTSKGTVPAVTVRSAGAAKLAKIARTAAELDELRVQVLSEKATPGEKYVAGALRNLKSCIAYVCVHIPRDNHPIYGQNIEVDAIVITPTFLGVVEVKDTRLRGKVTPAGNGAWYVGDAKLHDGNSFPTDQVVTQAKVLGSHRKELGGLPRVPGFVAIHGEDVHFDERPFQMVLPGACFACVSGDVVPAIEKFQTLSAPKITVAKVQALMNVLGLERSLRMNRQELGLLGFPEDTLAID